MNANANHGKVPVIDIKSEPPWAPVERRLKRQERLFRARWTVPYWLVISGLLAFCLAAAYQIHLNHAILNH